MYHGPTPHTRHDALSDMDADDELKLSLAAVVIATVAKKRKKQRQVRSCWVRPWICSRPRFGGHETLLKDLAVSDCKAHQNFCRISNNDYQQILALVSPLITYEDTRYRQAISARSFDMSKEIEKKTCSICFDMSKGRKNRSTCCQKRH